MSGESGSTSRRQAVGVREVAERAGVAISSVSRVLSDHPDVSDRMRERVMAAADELGYEPDLLAQSLRRGETLSIGFVVRDISNLILAELALGAETVLAEAGYSMLLTNSHGDPDADAQGIRVLRRRRVDGLLVSLSDERHQPTRDELDQISVPFVLIDRELPGDESAGAVVTDYRTAFRAAVRHLLELGHRRIGLIVGGRGIYPMRAMEQIVREACEEGGATLLVESGELRAGDAIAETLRLLDMAEPPTAIVSGSNQIVEGVLRAVRDRGVRVPEDLSLVSMDDVPMLDLLEPPLAVVRREPAEIGRTAAEELLARMRGGGSPRVVVLPAAFDPRGSVGPPPG